MVVTNYWVNNSNRTAP